MTDTIYAIGDIHGHLAKLKQAHRLIEQDQITNNTIGAKTVHIGDLTDRGPDSNGVISILIDGIAKGHPWIVVKGNHDRLFQKFVEDANWIDRRLRSDYTWLHQRMGGHETLASYGIKATVENTAFDLHIKAKSAVPEAHLAFLQGLPLYHQHHGLLFVHAGIRPNIAIADQTEDDLLWIRQEFIESDVDFGPLVVHGHTMVKQIEHRKNRLNIDTGAGRGDDLSAVVIEGRTVWHLTENGRVKVPVISTPRP